ncbi:MAG TPA: hypothetical protein VH740_13910 [Vicinamibacterales bacterium]|jgi:hypothetical protein
MPRRLASTTTIVFLLVASLGVTAVGVQRGRGRADEKVRPLTRERVAELVAKRKAFHDKVVTRQKAPLARLEASRRAFESSQDAKLKEENRKTLEKIKGMR